MKPFSVHTLYVFHEALPLQESKERLRPSLETSPAGMGGAGESADVRSCLRPPSSRLSLDVPELNASLDSRQVRLPLTTNLCFGGRSVCFRVPGYNHGATYRV